MATSQAKRAAFQRKLAASQAPLKASSLSPAKLMEFETLFLDKLRARYKNVKLGVTRLFGAYDADKSGDLDVKEFGEALKFLLNGFKDEDVLAVAGMYDGDGSGTVSLVELVDRLTSPDAGVVPPANKPPPPPPVADENDSSKANGKAAPIKPSEIPMVGSLSTRLAKFRAGIKGLYASRVARERKSLRPAQRMHMHSSSINSDLTAEISRKNIFSTFDSVGGPRNGANVPLGKWIAVFDHMCRSPTQPSLNPKDLEALWKECGDGNVEIFVDSLFPAKPTPQALIAANKLYGNTESVYKNVKDYCDPGNPENSSNFFFDSLGEGERRIAPPPETSVPNRINYRYCRTPVAPPSGFDVETVAMSGRLPVADLTLEHVQGFKGDGDTCNLYSVAGDKLVYTIAALGIVYDVATNTQKFFRSHDDDITCLTVFEPDERAGKVKKARAASGQMGYDPVFCIWEIDTCIELYRLGGKGVFARAVCGVSFSWDGKHVAAVGMDDNHKMGVWNLVGGKDRDTDEIIPKLLTLKDTQAGTPPMLTSIVWCPFAIPVEVQGTGSVRGGSVRSGSRASISRASASRAGANRPSASRTKAPSRASLSRTGAPSRAASSRAGAASSSASVQALITTGKGKHLKFWTWAPDRENLQPTHPTGPATFQNARFGKAPLPKILTDCAPIRSKGDKNVGNLVAVSGVGAANQVPSGYVYLFQISTATCMSFVEAHPQAPVYSLRFDDFERTLYSGGGDGVLHCWEVSPRLAKKSSVDLSPPSPKPVSFLHHPESVMNKATLMTNRKTVFRKANIYNADEETPEALAGPKKGGSKVRGEGDVLVQEGPSKPKLKHLALIRSPVEGEGGEGGKLRVAVGFAKGSVSLVDPCLPKGAPVELRSGHCQHVYGLACHPLEPSIFVTVGEDGFLCIWDAKIMKCKRRRSLFGPGKSVAFSPDAKHLAVGMFNGVVLILSLAEVMSSSGDNFGKLKTQHAIHDCEEDVDDLKYSPSGEFLAVGSHDNYVDVYEVSRGYGRKWRLKGHTSYVTHLDWSEDSRIIQSNCGAYEILYWDVKTGRQIRSTLDSLEADTSWSTWTCVLGFPVMGIWPPSSDGTDVNSVDRCHRGTLCVTADDFGAVNLHRFPCVAKAAAKKEYTGHAAHVMNVRFLLDDSYVVSVGGKDRAICCWRLNRNLHLEDHQAAPKPTLATRWKPQGGWDNGRALEAVGPSYAMTDQFANSDNPRACGWVQKQQKDGSYKTVLIEPEKPYGDYKGRYNDHSSSRA